jgi:hypothetical protein
MSVFILMICQLPFDELTPEEEVRQSEKEKRRLAAKAQEEAIEGNTANENNLQKVNHKLVWWLTSTVLQKQRSVSLKLHF